MKKMRKSNEEKIMGLKRELKSKREGWKREKKKLTENIVLLESGWTIWTGSV